MAAADASSGLPGEVLQHLYPNHARAAFRMLQQKPLPFVWAEAARTIGLRAVSRYKGSDQDPTASACLGPLSGNTMSIKDSQTYPWEEHCSTIIRGCPDQF